jgi:hypothetical protein
MTPWFDAANISPGLLPHVNVLRKEHYHDNFSLGRTRFNSRPTTEAYNQKMKNTYRAELKLSLSQKKLKPVL